MMDSNLRAGYDVAFLTARGAEQAVFTNLMKWLKYRNLKGEFVDLKKNKVKVYIQCLQKVLIVKKSDFLNLFQD